MSSAKSFYDLKAELPGTKGPYDFSQLKGKVVLIVNVASQWYVPILSFSSLFVADSSFPNQFSGFTPQYTGLQKLHDKYKDKDFVLLGFPCNQASVASLSIYLAIVANDLDY